MRRRARITWLATFLTTLLCLGIMVLGAFGYRATIEWQRSSALLVERQELEGARLVTVALERDMRGAQSTVLAGRDWGDFSTHEPLDIVDSVAAAFARYPYPESFFSWTEAGRSSVTFFNRADRLPAWMPHSAEPVAYPVALATNPAGAPDIRSRVDAYGASHHGYAVFNTTIAGMPYQIVARLTYADRMHERLQSVAGFTVNLEWVRHVYFHEILSQVARLADSSGNLDLAVLDERGNLVCGHAVGQRAAHTQFPLLFVEPSVTPVDLASSAAAPVWSVRVSTKNNSALLQTMRGADRMLLAAAAAVFALGFGLVLVTRAVRAGVALSELRSDFVASVTHDLKTPLASMRALADTIAHRHMDVDTVQEYARLMTEETKRLTRRVDNLLAYARVTDVTDVYSFEPTAPVELVDDALNEFTRLLTDQAFTVQVDVHPDLPLIRGDRTALMLALCNLIDNAIRYSEAHRSLRVTARRSAKGVVIEVCDHGIGIPADELSTVQCKFVRGRFARADGSGLGLAIVNRVVADHGGSFSLESQLGAGTIARIVLPAGE